MEYSLNGSWQLHFTDPAKGETEIPAQVPGNVIGDLHRAGLLPDPYVGTNSLLTRPYEFIDWTYITSFSTPDFDNDERVELCFEGVDTVFDLYVNGEKIGCGRNMYIEHRFDVTQYLRKDHKANQLRVKIASSVNFARCLSRPAAFDCQPYNYEGWQLRRAVHTYGWDIAPRLVGAGIWRGVSLRVLKPIRWRDSYLYTQWMKDDRTGMVLHWELDTNSVTLDGYSAELEMSCGESHYRESFPMYFTSGRHYFQLRQPLLWWPHGTGEPHLYQTTLRLLYHGKVCDERIWRTGVRDIRLERSETNFHGEGKFRFVVNNRPIFILGSNWVPANALHGEHTELIRRNVVFFSELGCNMVRCWGGGVYEDHEFFDLCDERGLLVWQDFMLACTMPPQDTESLQQLTEEAESVIRKLRQHASLAIWCGDNECDQRFFAVSERRNPSMNRVSRDVFAHATFAHDPGRDYLPSSPYFCDEVKEKNARYASPEQHLWGTRDNWKNPFYLNDSAVFASEIGYPGAPSLESIRRFIPEASLNDRTPQNPDWLCHSAQPFGDSSGCYAYRTGLLNDMVKDFLGNEPETLEAFVEASQIVQAEAMKYFIENFRMRKWRKTGIIWWNMSDCWPQFSEAVVDYYGKRKLAFHYIQNVQKPVLLMFGEPESWQIRLYGICDLNRPCQVRYRVTDFMTGTEFLSGETLLEAGENKELDSIKIYQGEQHIWQISYEYNGHCATNHYWQGTPPVSMELYRKWLHDQNHSNAMHQCFFNEY